MGFSCGYDNGIVNGIANGIANVKVFDVNVFSDSKLTSNYSNFISFLYQNLYNPLNILNLLKRRNSQRNSKYSFSLCIFIIIYYYLLPFCC